MNRIGIFTSILFLVSLSGMAEPSGSSSKGTASLPFQVNGRIYTDQYVLTNGKDAGSLEQSSVSSWLDLNSQFTEHFGGRLITQFDAFYRDINHPETSSFNAVIREGYLSYLTNGTEIRAGQQIIPWGKSDGVNPTDYFTAKDYTLLNADDEVRRLGAPGLNVSFTPDAGNSPFTFQAVFQASYPQMKLLVPSQAIPSGVSFQKYPSSPGFFKNSSMEYGLKVSYQKSSFDFSLSAYQGYNHFPEYVFTPSTGAIRPINPAETAFGGDASFTWQKYVIRLETALLMPENGTDTDPLFGLVEPWHWDSVVGAEQPVGDDFRLQVQFLYRWHLYYPNPSSFNPIQVAVGRANALILNYQQQGNPGCTFRFGYQSDHSDWTADFFMFGYFGGGENYLLRPQIGYTPITNLKLTTGMDYYGGNESKPLGALHDKSHGFLEAKYVF
jgi:hypothetical protein